MSLESTDLRNRIAALMQSGWHEGAILGGQEAVTGERSLGD